MGAALMGAVEDRLALWGVLRPEVTVRAARDAGLELAAACTCLFRETGGGRMVWGSDGAPTARRTDAAGAVIYTFGGPVTPENYLRYRAAQRAGLIPRQGVGDCQLTSEDYVARAEAIGGPAGPADPYANQRAGFAGLAAHIRSYGDRRGFVAYNGGPGALSKGPTHPAQVYGDKAVAALAIWRDRLGPLNSTAGAPAPAPTPEDDDVSWTANEGAPRVPDRYEGVPAGSTLPDPLEALGWATAHAAHARNRASEARDVANAALGEVRGLRGDLEHLLAGGGAPALTRDDVRALLVEALAELGPLYLTGNTTPNTGA